jgi:hypothetical protein
MVLISADYDFIGLVLKDLIFRGKKTVNLVPVESTG